MLDSFSRNKNDMRGYIINRWLNGVITSQELTAIIKGVMVRAR